MIDPLNAVLIPMLQNDSALQALGFQKAYAGRIPEKTPFNFTLLWQPPNDQSFGETPLETLRVVAMITSRFLVDFITDKPNDDAVTAANERVKALWFRAKSVVPGYRVLGATYETARGAVRTLQPSGTEVRVVSIPWVWRVAPL